MSTSAKVTDESGNEIEITVFSAEEMTAFFNDQSGAGKKAAMTYLRLLGKPVNEIVKMDASARVKWVTDRYAQLGVGAAKAKSAVGKTNGVATTSGLRTGKPATTTTLGADKPKSAVSKVGVAAASTEDEDDEQPGAPAASKTTNAPAGDSTAILKGIGALTSLVGQLREEQLGLQVTVAELQEANAALTALVRQQEKTLLDVHLIARVIARAGHDFGDDIIREFAAECYDMLVVEPVENEGESTEDEEQQLEGNV